MRRRLKHYVRSATTILFLLAPVASVAGEIVVTEAWIFAPVPKLQVNAAYMRIENRGEVPFVLTGISSAAYERAEIHATRTESGVTAMQALAQIEVLPGKPVAFAPGGVHAMLIGLQQPLRNGDSVAIELIGADGTRIPISAQVCNKAPAFITGASYCAPEGHRHAPPATN